MTFSRENSFSLSLFGSLIFILSFFWILPHSFYGTMGTGLDPSWQIALQLAIDSQKMFGTEFVFTHGPLGFLSTRLPFPSNYSKLILFDLYLFASIFLILFQALSQAKFSLKSKLGLSVIFLLSGFGLYFQDLAVILFSIFLFQLLNFINTSKKHYLILAGINSILIFYNKLNLGIIAPVFIILTLACIFYENRKSYFPIFAAVFYLISLIGTSYFLKTELLSYIKSTLEIISGHNQVMALINPDSYPYLYTALFCLACLTFCILINIKTILLKWQSFLTY
ncbi:MAG: hypothetical protein KDD56_06320, partial [Bdellovibrionales bacterium]|nr:hypothetical protein [Bdellovibrionales bacterium]